MSHSKIVDLKQLIVNSFIMLSKKLEDKEKQLKLNNKVIISYIQLNL